jgi:hypothetical protein
MPGLRVAQHIRGRFLNHAETGDFKVRRKPRHVQVTDQPHVHAGVLALALRESPQRGFQAEHVEHRRPQIQRQLADLIDGAVDEGDVVRQHRLPARATLRF